MRKYRLKLSYVVILCTILFVSFIIYHEHRVRSSAQYQLTEHGNIISNALWNLDTQSPLKYLEQACVVNNYKSLLLKDEMGAIFISIDSDTIPELRDITTTLLPQIELSADIMYHDRKIGSISVTWYNESVYVYINIFIISLLLIAVLNLYLKLLYANSNLEHIVAERTAELENANRALSDHKELLEELVEKRTKALIASQQEALDNAHRAGMADIANGALHNIGNILNSVNTSAHMIEELVNSDFKNKFNRANQILMEHEQDLEHFITTNPKAVTLIHYYLELGKLYETNSASIISHVKRLKDKIRSTVDVITAQQTYAGTASMKEPHNIKEIIEDAIMMELDSLRAYEIEVINSIEKYIVEIEKTKIIHIILNLLKNARDAMLQTPKGFRKLTLTTEADSQFLHIKVSDTGCGISASNINKVFSHGFTTKKDGHGFGLHSCANYMTEMNGTISVESPGIGHGTTFTLTLPLHKN